MANRNTKYRNSIIRSRSRENKCSEATTIENNRSNDPVMQGYPPTATGNTSFRVYGI